MTLPVVLTAGTSAYNIQRSLRFRSSASAYLNRTPATTTNRQIWTWSAWFKQGNALNSIFSTNSSDNLSYNYFGFDTNAFRLYQWNGSGYDFQFITTPVYRDPSAWYHFVIQVDTTQATAANRVRFYVNGVQVTAFSTNTTPSQNLNTYVNNSSYSHLLCRNPAGSSTYCDGYLAEINFIDGQALTPSSFGQTDSATGVWQPAKYTGTYGTNGFYLPFTDTTSTTTISEDFSGNNNDWTSNNISLTAGSTYDSMTDVPTNTNSNTANYCVLNPLDPLIAFLSVTLSNGNLTASGTTYGASVYTATMQVPSTGKWYWETVYTTITSICVIGIRSYSTGSTDVQYRSDGQKFVGSTTSAYGASWTTNDVIGIAVDRDAGTVTFYKNNSSQGVINIPTNSAAFDIAFGVASPWGATTFNVNFGQRPFSYTPPTGFVALNTFNLPTPTIGATASTTANKYFDATTFTGNASTNVITNSGSMQPDMVWLKSRSNANSHTLYDAIRGVNTLLYPNLTNAEAVGTNQLTSFNSNGFTLGASENANDDSGESSVGWQWRASNAAGVTNTAGSITSTVSANTSAGFSIVTYTGNGSGGATVGHGLGVAPAFYIVKQRTASSATSWYSYHSSIDATPQNYAIYLNLTNAKDPASVFWNNTAPTSSVFSLGTSTGVNGSSGTYVAYCFAQVAGYSAFGSYTGNGSTDGPFIFTGFRPRFVMVKRTDSTGDWAIEDTSRDPYNVAINALLANSSTSELSYLNVDYLSNGFKLRTTDGSYNVNGGTYIYMAFAENPFKYSLAR